jgi:hypothetical protein
MGKKDITKVIDKIFLPLGFKRKANNWVSNGDKLSKIINLQKSNHSNSFFVNFGFVINGLVLTTSTHVESRLSSTNREEQKRITDILDLDFEIPQEQRLEELESFLTDKLAGQMNTINTEEDLLKHIKTRTHLNDISLVVKKHFNLPI